MNLNNTHKIPKFDYLILLPIMGLAFYIAFIPHLNYPYPLHVDEWAHLATSKAMLTAGSIIFPDPFFGGPIVDFTPNPETGFHLFWAVFQSITGLSWLAIFRYFPSVIFIITVLSVYVLARREGFGWEAAFLTCLIPTTVGILGPAFLVPVTLGLPFIPLSLFLVFNFRTWWSYVILFIFSCFLLFMHAATIVGLVIILLPFILLNLRSDFKHSLCITLVLGIAFLAPFPWISGMLLPTAESLLSPQPPQDYVELPRILQTYGYLPILLCLLGVFLLSLKGIKRNYCLVLGLLALLLMLVTFFTLHYGVPILFYRGLTYTMLMMSIIGGAGLMGIKHLKIPEKIGTRLKLSLVTQNIGKVLCLALVGLTLATSIPARQSTPYYQMIDKQDYEAFVWIKENLDADYSMAVLDPWKATAFVAITGRNIRARIQSHPRSFDNRVYEFLEGDCSDTEFLRYYSVHIVYTRSTCRNPDLIEVRENVYLLREVE